MVFHGSFSWFLCVFSLFKTGYSIGFLRIYHENYGDSTKHFMGVEQNNNIVGISWDINDLETMTTETSWEKMEIYIYIYNGDIMGYNGI